MAKKIAAPKGSQIKAESKTKLLINQINYEMGNTRSTPGVGVKAAINGAKVKRAFQIGKNSKGNKSLL